MQKPKIKHLVIMSGPCESGKSTFIDNMDLKRYSNKLRLNKENVTYVSGNILRKEKLSKSFALN